MAKYYQVGSMSEIKNALLDYYGANVTIHADSTTQVIFSCAQVSDKVIKITGYSDVRSYYGDAFSGGDITNPVEFGGSTTSGSTSNVHMVCGDTFVLLNVLASSINSRLVIISQLTDNSFMVYGFIGQANVIYTIDAGGYVTTSNTEVSLSGLDVDCNIGAKAFLMKPIIIDPLGSALSVGGVQVSFKDIYSVSKKKGNATVGKGPGYFLTTSGLYDKNSNELKCSLFVEVTN